jgi:hypothetical protein
MKRQITVLANHAEYMIWDTEILIQPMGHVRMAYHPLNSSTFISEQINHQLPTNITFLSEQINTNN